MKSAYWPAEVTGQWRGLEIRLRPLHPRRDAKPWMQLRSANREWTGPWDSTSPAPGRPLPFKQWVKAQDAEAHAGRLLPWVLEVNGELAGQVHIFSIMRGAQYGGTIGYWIDHRWAGYSIMPFAVALAIDYAFNVEKLHRIEINIRPENANSLRVVEKLGLREEGVRLSFLHINGAWCDHRTFAVTADEVGPDGMVARLTQKSGG